MPRLQLTRGADGLEYSVNQQEIQVLSCWPTSIRFHLRGNLVSFGCLMLKGQDQMLARTQYRVILSPGARNFDRLM